MRHSCERITRLRAWESVRREVYSSLARAWKSTNVVVGATFLLGSKAPVHRKHRNFTVLPAFFSARNLTAEAGKQGHRGEDLRSHGFDLRRYGGEGKTASSGLRNPSRRDPNPSPGRCLCFHAPKNRGSPDSGLILELAYAAKQRSNVFWKSFIKLAG